jgi:hypothetical protein
MIGLPHYYRFKVYNDLGQTISTGNVTVKARRVNFDTDGGLVFEGSEATVLSNGSGLADNTYLAGTTQNNSSLKWVGGTFVFSVVAPASSDGDVFLYLERSTDAGTTWDTDGLGQAVAALNFTTSGTKVLTFSL